MFSLRGINYIDLGEFWFENPKWTKRFEGENKGKGQRWDPQVDGFNEQLALSMVSRIFEKNGAYVKRIDYDRDLDPKTGKMAKVDYGLECMHDGKLKYILAEYKCRWNMPTAYIKNGLMFSVDKRNALNKLLVKKSGNYYTVDRVMMWSSKDYLIVRRITESNKELEERFPVREGGARPMPNARSVEPMHFITFRENEGIMIHKTGKVGKPSNFK